MEGVNLLFFDFKGETFLFWHKSKRKKSFSLFKTLNFFYFFNPFETVK